MLGLPWDEPYDEPTKFVHDQKIQELYSRVAVRSAEMDADAHQTQFCTACGAVIDPHHDKCEYCGTFYTKGQVNNLAGGRAR